MLDPFTLQKHLLKEILSIGRRLLVGACRAIWHGPSGRRERVGNTMDRSLRGMGGAIARFFRR